MTKSSVKLLDKAIADDLGLVLSPKTYVLKRVIENPTTIDGFVFAFEQGSEIHYDRLEIFRFVNGRRIKLPRFMSTPLIESRLVKRQYKRWYVWGNGMLFPVQNAKAEDLKTNFLFITGDIPNYQTSIIYSYESPHLRKNPLRFHHALQI
ncbi:hypothetical protein PHABIO_49 [Pseudomonas phage Phabio]|uniref:Uncharacterized protein n=1 Tax=Pseudomonas phage Phabio TaxID=2006668 RepID=A0A1Y0STN8_9CAUD|nr:hypothetical protein MZD05_gp049 [Pseudomonas phage Phabio]ARV76680.1 hypothetical protein PHABIO_49 [Pseudomonas phage Phabio]